MPTLPYSGTDLPGGQHPQRPRARIVTGFASAMPALTDTGRTSPPH